MAAAQDIVIYSSPGATGSQNAGRGYFKAFNSLFCVPILGREPSSDSLKISESQGSPSLLRVLVTVHRAHNIPCIENLGLKFFVYITSPGLWVRTRSVPNLGTAVHWNEVLEYIFVQPSSPLVLRLYEERFSNPNILIGTCEMIPVESQTEVPFVLANGDRQVGESIQPVTLYLSTTVGPEAFGRKNLPS